MTAPLHHSPEPITCPSSLVAACGPLLGFEPDNCLICLVAVPGRAGRVVARVDLVPDSAAAACARRLAESLSRTGGVRVAIVLWTDAPDDLLRGQVPALTMVDELTPRLHRAGIGVELLLATNGSVWWELACRRPQCCPEGGQPVDADVAGAVRLQFAIAGCAPLASRQELARRLEPEPGAVELTRGHLARTRPSRGSSRWRERQLRLVWPLLDPGDAQQRCSPDRHTHPSLRGAAPWPPPSASAASTARPPSGPVPGREAVVLALTDMGVRDVILLRLAGRDTTCRSCWERTLEVLAAVVRACPPNQVAPSATLLAVAAWLAGEGALATLALDRALTDQPDYRLAQLTSRLIGSGVDPRTWRGSIVGLTEAECLRAAQRGQSPGGGDDVA